MNGKRAKLLRKQVGHKPSNQKGQLEGSAAEIKKKYLSLKRNYRTPAQIRQDKFEAECLKRRNDAPVVFVDAETQKAREERKLARQAKPRGMTAEQKAESVARHAAHEETCRKLEASERAFRLKFQLEQRRLAEQKAKLKEERRQKRVKAKVQTADEKTA